jgi:hypothetical protein
MNAATADNAVSYSAGTGIDVTGSVITNTMPDQTVTLSNGAGISVSGTYPGFVVSNTGVTSLVAGSGINISGTTGDVTITNTAPGISGSGTNDYLPKWNGAASLANSQIYDNGKVGIGTANPQQKLDVAGGIQIGNVDTPSYGSMRFYASDFEGYTFFDTWESFTKTQYQSLTSAPGGILSTARNTEVISPDSMVVSLTGWYFMLFNVDGDNSNYYITAPLDLNGDAKVRRVSTGDISASIPFFKRFTDSDGNGATIYNKYMGIYSSTSSFIFLTAGDVLKVVAYVNSNGTPAGDWQLLHYSVQLMKMMR